MSVKLITPINLLNILLHALFICCEADKRHSLHGGVQNLAFCTLTKKAVRAKLSCSPLSLCCVLSLLSIYIYIYATTFPVFPGSFVYGRFDCFKLLILQKNGKLTITAKRKTTDSGRKEKHEKRRKLVELTLMCVSLVAITFSLIILSCR